MSQIHESRLKILVARPDRVGDVILSTPVFEVLKKHYPDSHVTVLVREAVAVLIRGLPSVDEVIIFDPEGKHKGLNGLFALVREFRERNIRIGIVLQSHWKVAAALFAAGVRYRVGPLSKLHSFLFYNRGIRQRRSRVEMHETDYNLQLLRRLGIRVGTRTVPPQVHVEDVEKEKALTWLRANGWKGGADSRPLIAVHPGMGGSALNWPESHYVDLIQLLIKNDYSVLVTGGPTEDELLGRIKLGFETAVGEKAAQSASLFYYGGKAAAPLNRLAALLSFSSVVVAPSTGPLHLAVAMSKPVVSFYPPIRVQSAIRWGPYVKEDEAVSVLVPDVYCGQDFECRGTLCNYFPCMQSMLVAQVYDEIQRLVKRGKKVDA